MFVDLTRPGGMDQSILFVHPAFRSASSIAARRLAANLAQLSNPTMAAPKRRVLSRLQTHALFAL